MLETLFVNWHMNPEIFSIGPISLRWYSVLFLSGFGFGWYIFKWFFKREGIPTTLLDPLLFTLLIGTIIGARLGHCLFYQPDYYLTSWQGFTEIFMPWTCQPWRYYRPYLRDVVVCQEVWPQA